QDPPAEHAPDIVPPEKAKEGPNPAVAEEPKVFDEVEVFKPLREAKQKLRDTIAADQPRLIAECQEVVKREAAVTGDLALAKELLKEVEELKTNGKVPTKKQFE